MSLCLWVSWLKHKERSLRCVEGCGGARGPACTGPRLLPPTMSLCLSPFATMPSSTPSTPHSPPPHSRPPLSAWQWMFMMAPRPRAEFLSLLSTGANPKRLHGLGRRESQLSAWLRRASRHPSPPSARPGDVPSRPHATGGAHPPPANTNSSPDAVLGGCEVAGGHGTQKGRERPRRGRIGAKHESKDNSQRSHPSGWRGFKAAHGKEQRQRGFGRAWWGREGWPRAGQWVLELGTTGMSWPHRAQPGSMGRRCWPGLKGSSCSTFLSLGLQIVPLNLL